MLGVPVKHPIEMLLGWGGQSGVQQKTGLERVDGSSICKKPPWKWMRLPGGNGDWDGNTGHPKHTSHHCTWPPLCILSGWDMELQPPRSLGQCPILTGPVDTTPPGCCFLGHSTIPSPVALWVLLVHCSVLKFPSAFLPPCLHRSLLAHSHCGLAVAQTRWLESASGWTNRFQDTVTS